MSTDAVRELVGEIADLARRLSDLRDQLGAVARAVETLDDEIRERLQQLSDLLADADAEDGDQDGGRP